MTRFRLFIPLIVVAVGCVVPARADDGSHIEARWVSSDRLSIWFQAADGATHDTRAELWYTTDGSATWQRWGDQSAGKTPIDFNAPADGLYGFFIVLKNAAGASSPPPARGTVAQQWIGVDREAPTVQILSLRPDARFDLNREIHIRWKATDAGFADRPVSIHYRCPTRKTYTLVADALGPTGEMRWTVPEDVEGKLEIKISSNDQAGNIGRCVGDKLTLRNGKITQPVPIQQAKPASTTKAEAPTEKIAVDTSEPARPAPPKPDPLPIVTSVPANATEEQALAVQTAAHEAADEASRLYELGSWHRMRGEHELAVARYQESLKLDSDQLAARNDLAGVLCVLKQFKEAEKQFQLVLWKDDSNRVALRGLALVQATQRDYRSAIATLSKLLLLEPTDAEAWLYFGDVELFAGDRIAARQAWRRVESLPDVPEQARQQAQRRLAIYAGDR
jgi:hypothetical protein